MTERDRLLGTYLRDRRERLDPMALGFASTRRRTPGLRREEVAQRATISATWYTWLEQGRGGAASADVLDRIAHALMLNEAEREHLFLLGLGRPPEAVASDDDSVSPRLQRVLDALEPSGAMIRNACWDVLAWNRTASVLLTDYGALPPAERNILRLIFLNPSVRIAQQDWEHTARFVVSSFRADTVRAGAMEKVRALVDELSHKSPEFAAMWRDNDVIRFGSGLKSLQHPVLGACVVEYSAFAVDGRPDLGMVVYNPVDPRDIARLRDLIAAQSCRKRDTVST